MKRSILLAAAAVLVAFPLAARAQGGYVTGSSSATAIPGAGGSGASVPIDGRTWPEIAAGTTWTVNPNDRSPPAMTTVGGAGGAGSQAVAQTQGQQQAQRAVAQGGSASNSNALTVNSSRARLQAPGTAFGYAAAPCVNGGGVWGSGPGFSVGGTLSAVDANCHDLNVAVFLAQMGRPDMALALLLQQPRVLKAAEIVASSPNPYPAAPVVAPAPVVAMAPIVGPGDRPRRVVRRPVAAKVAAAAPCASSCPQPN